MRWIILVVSFVLLSSKDVWAQATAAWPVGTKVSQEIPEIPQDGPYSQREKVLPAPAKDLGAAIKVVMVYHVARDQDFQSGYQERINTAAAFINSFFADAALHHLWERGQQGDRANSGLSFVMDNRNPSDVAVLLVHGERQADGYWTRAKKFNHHVISQETVNAFRQAANGADPRRFVFMVFSDAAIYSQREGRDTASLGGRDKDVPVALTSGKNISPENCASTIEEQLSLLRARPSAGSFSTGAHEIGHSLGGLSHDTDRVMLNRRLVTVSPRYSIMSVVHDVDAQNFSPDINSEAPKVRFRDDEITKLMATGALTAAESLRISKR